jgi:hypothetical protein
MICAIVQAPPSALDVVEWKDLENSILQIGLFEGDRIYRRRIAANLWELHTRSAQQLAKLSSATPSGTGAKVLTPGEGRARGLFSKISKFDGGREAQPKDIESLKVK